MWRWFYESNHLLGFALFALLFFVVFFAAVVVRTMTQSRSRIADMAAMPLLDDAEAPRAARTETSHG